jgi:hypothetical protein
LHPSGTSSKVAQKMLGERDVCDGQETSRKQGVEAGPEEVRDTSKLPRKKSKPKPGTVPGTGIFFTADVPNIDGPFFTADVPSLHGPANKGKTGCSKSEQL